MNKKTILVCLISVLLVLTGCSKSDDKTTMGTSTNNAEQSDNAMKNFLDKTFVKIKTDFEDFKTKKDSLKDNKAKEEFISTNVRPLLDDCNKAIKELETMDNGKLSKEDKKSLDGSLQMLKGFILELESFIADGEKSTTETSINSSNENSSDSTKKNETINKEEGNRVEKSEKSDTKNEKSGSNKNGSGEKHGNGIEDSTQGDAGDGGVDKYGNHYNDSDYDDKYDYDNNPKEYKE